MATNMVRAIYFSKTEAIIRAVLIVIKFMDMASIIGLIQGPIQDIGSTIECLEKEYLNGRMVKFIKDCF